MEDSLDDFVLIDRGCVGDEEQRGGDACGNLRARVNELAQKITVIGPGEEAVNYKCDVNVDKAKKPWLYTFCAAARFDYGDGSATVVSGKDHRTKASALNEAAGLMLPKLIAIQAARGPRQKLEMPCLVNGCNKLVKPYELGDHMLLCHCEEVVSAVKTDKVQKLRTEQQVGFVTEIHDLHALLAADTTNCLSEGVITRTKQKIKGITKVRNEPTGDKFRMVCATCGVSCRPKDFGEHTLLYHGGDVLACATDGVAQSFYTQLVEAISALKMRYQQVVSEDASCTRAEERNI